MHDIVDLERRGTPSVFVASREFIDAAAAQAGSLGADPRGVFVDHPVQDRTDEEIRVLADGAFPSLVDAITLASSRST